MLVWKAIESITPMMSLILRLLALMAPMVCTTPATTWPPCVAVCAAEEANWLA